MVGRRGFWELVSVGLVVAVVGKWRSLLGVGECEVDIVGG